MILLMMFLSIGQATQSNLVAVKALDADKQGYQAWLNLNHDVTPYLNSKKDDRKVTDDFFLAKTQALKGNTRDAKERFLAVTEVALESDWQEDQQEIIFHSFLFLSELADAGFEKKLWLKRAIGFLPWYQPKLDSYSTATQNLFKRVQKDSNLKQYVWRPYERFSKFDAVLVNGSRFEINPQSEIILGFDQYRLTFIAPDIHTQTRLVQTESLNSISVSEEPMVDGSCETPKSHLPQTPGTIYVVFFSKDCVRQFDGQKWSDFQKLAQILPKYNLAQETINKMGFEPSKPDTKKRWKWIGVSVLAAAVGYAIYDHNRPTEIRQVVVQPED